jgi:hypothetical protein
MRQSNREFGEIAGLAIGCDCAAMLLGHDVVANREAETSALAGRLGREERLEQLSLISAGIRIPLSRTSTSTASPRARVDTFGDPVLIHRSAICLRTKRSKGRSWTRTNRNPGNIRLDKFFPSVIYVTHLDRFLCSFAKQG